MNDYKLLVLENAVPGREAEFDAWLNVHLEELVQKAAPLRTAQRFRSVEPSPGDRPPHPHLVLCDWRAENLADSWTRHLEALHDGVAAGTYTPLTTALDRTSSLHWLFEPAGPRLRK